MEEDENDQEQCGRCGQMFDEDYLTLEDDGLVCEWCVETEE